MPGRDLNLEPATASFLAVSVTLPISLLVITVYILGMVTGGFLLAVLRGWVHRATRKPKESG